MKKKKSIEALEDSFSQVLEGKVNRQSAVRADARAGSVGDLQTAGQLPGISLEVSEDAMRAVMRARGAAAVSCEQILDALQEQRVTFGVDKAAIHVAVGRIAKAGGWRGELVVARGELPESPYELDYPFLEQVGVGALGSKSCVWLVDGIPLFPNLARLFNLKSLRDLTTIENVVVKAVSPMDVIVRIARQRSGRPGRNIFGEEIKEEGFPLQIGANISYDSKNSIYVSELYGYVLAEGNRLAVLEPVWISPDKMEAFYVNLPQVGTPVMPSSSDLIAMLLKRGLKQACLRTKVIEQLCDKLREGEKLPCAVKVAAGIEPKRGLDADIKLIGDFQKRAGTLRRDDTIDLRERNVVVTVCKGDLVAEKRMATKGEPGCTLLGQELPAEDGQDRDFQVGPGIVQEKKEGRILYIAKADGNVTFRGNTLSIVEVYNLQSDVDYTTGNISVNTDLSIDGSVGPGFTVRAEGNIQIQGMVETGALVFAKGNLSIGKGVVGETTRIITYGNLYAQFIQDAEVLAKGDIIIGSYVYNGLIRAGGTIIVKKEMGSQGGKIVGGVVCASKGVECSTIGSPTNRNTVVSLQVPPDKATSLKAYNEKLGEYDQLIMKMMRTLQLDSVDPLAIRDKLDKVPAEKKGMYTKILLKLNNAIKEKNSIEQEKRDLQEKVDSELAKANIRVSSEVYQGSEIQIGTTKMVAPNDLGPSVFQLQDGKITV